ncbi:DUF6333 family protein [Streptomyces noursei]|uniref:DUF6333 family protein n=1 Tax=Streptomyces noursei TaxID=1971 RepID=UPI0023B798C8|nr:DUF6333 family protein [Streptomyces noursei]
MSDADVHGGPVHDDEAEHDPDEEVQLWRPGEVTLTLLFPPFPDPDVTEREPLPAHDPVRARRVVEELGTVAEVLEQLPERPVGDLAWPEVRADLDFVAVGCWGGVVMVFEPALGSDLLREAMTAEVARQRARHPEARIVGSVALDYGNCYLEEQVLLPSGQEVFAGGWDCDDEDGWTFAGDPREVLRAIGVDRETAAEVGFDLDDAPCERAWSDLGVLALGLHRSPAGGVEERHVSYFRVRRSQEGAANLADVWFARS